MNAGTLGHVFVRLSEELLTGVLRLDRNGERYVIQWADGRIVGVTDGDGVPLRSGFGQFLVAGGMISARRLLRERRKAARATETLEWRLAKAGVPEGQLRRLVSLDARERLLALMDEGGFVAKVVKMPPTPDAWLDPVSVPSLGRLWKERRAERATFGDRLPELDTLYVRTHKAPTELFRLRGVTVNESVDPYAAKSPTAAKDASAVFPPTARLVYLSVDGIRRVTELARAAGLSEHEARVALAVLHREGLVRSAFREATTALSLPGLGAVVALVLLVIAGGAAATQWPPAAPELPVDVDGECRAVQRTLAFEYWKNGRYPDTMDDLFKSGALPSGAESRVDYAVAETPNDYSLSCSGRGR